jgi:tetratricopeptide (TPR) repeat protein
MTRLLSLLILLAVLAVPLTAADRDANKEVNQLFDQAGKAMQANQYDAAIPLYEKVITDYPEVPFRWYDAQMGITQALIKKGDLDGALKSAHLCIDGAMSPDAFDNAIMTMANIMSAIDHNVDRANELIAFQLTGPASGKKNPLENIGYPSMPEREKAFDAIRDNAGNDAVASRTRAMTYLFLGKPKDALAQFAESFRRNENPYDISFQGGDLISIGLRAARGYRAGLDQVVPFVIYGPNGPDGQAGTADDIKDPFAGLLPPPPAAGEGGLSGIKPEDLALLKKVQDAAKLYAGDPRLQGDIRNPAFYAYQRANCATDGWGAPGQMDWYMRLMLGIEGDPPDKYNISNVMTGAMYAARGRETNYGGVFAFWDAFDDGCSERGLEPAKEVESARERFKKFCDQFAKMKFPPIRLNPLKEPVKYQ